jgi:hypothetical protein
MNKNHLPVNFLIVGAARSGTTTLYDAIKQHPEIFMPEMKEPDFFSGVSNHVNNYEQYLAIFNKRKGERVVGEASTSYLFIPGTTERIIRYLGEIKIIIMLRNPADRAFSNWKMEKRYQSRENLSFVDALEEEEERYRNRVNIRNWYTLMYFRKGLYYSQVKRYLDVFGESNVHVIIFEEFIKDQKENYSNVLEFLGVDPDFLPILEAKNVAFEPRWTWLYNLLGTPPQFIVSIYQKLPMFIKAFMYRILSGIHRRNRKAPSTDEKLPETLKKNMMQRYYPDIMLLETLLGKDLSIWYKQWIS